MKKITIVSLLTFVFLLSASNVFAISCTTSNFCTTSKTDLYSKNIGKFKYLDWTHTIEHSASFMMKSGFYDFKGKVESIGYTVKGEDTVNYHVSLFNFENEQAALELFTKLVLDNKYKVYKNSKGTVYQSEDTNSNSLIWLHNNVMVSINTNPDSPKGKDFFKKAFAIYSKKIKPQTFNELRADYPVSNTVQTSLPAKRDLSMDLKVNNSDTSITVKNLSDLDITWSSTGADRCEASGNFIPKKDKSGIWAQVDNDLPPNGSIKLLASGYSEKKNTYLSMLRIEVLCSNNTGNKNFSQVRDSVIVYVNK